MPTEQDQAVNCIYYINERCRNLRRARQEHENPRDLKETVRDNCDKDRNIERVCRDAVARPSLREQLAYRNSPLRIVHCPECGTRKHINLPVALTGNWPFCPFCETRMTLDSPEERATRLRILRGDLIFEDLTPPLSTPAEPLKLSDRECQVLELAARGKTSKQIGADLNLTESTISNHLQNIRDKAGVHKTSALIFYALEHGLIH